jgi:glycosyltransferase involved in cell wall biosynthesis
MKISIIIPTYNRPVLFKECLESCINQDLIPFEIIIGDDSSNSETTELVKHYLNNDKQIAINYHKHDSPKR